MKLREEMNPQVDFSCAIDPLMWVPQLLLIPLVQHSPKFKPTCQVFQKLEKRVSWLLAKEAETQRNVIHFQ